MVLVSIFDWGEIQMQRWVMSYYNRMFGHYAGIHYQCHGVLVAQSLGFGT